eukprot:COSAG02_NODE_4063_length_5842_cov_25.729061_5_plen_56_part_00
MLQPFPINASRYRYVNAQYIRMLYQHYPRDATLAADTPVSASMGGLYDLPFDEVG